MKDILDEQEFYELMQRYRHTPIMYQEAVRQAFEDVKTFIRAQQRNHSGMKKSKKANQPRKVKKTNELAR